MAQRTTILLVDDHPNVREIVASELEETGYRVLTAEDGAQAMILLAEGGVDLILLDWHMPGMDGHTFLNHKFGDARFASIPVIVCTGLESPEPRPSGVEEILRKPLSILQLQRSIQAALTSC